MPVWHVSVSVWTDDGRRKRDEQRAAEREAVRLLADVGGDVEWWWWNPQVKVGWCNARGGGFAGTHHPLILPNVMPCGRVVA